MMANVIGCTVVGAEGVASNVADVATATVVAATDASVGGSDGMTDEMGARVLVGAQPSTPASMGSRLASTRMDKHQRLTGDSPFADALTRCRGSSDVR